MSADGLRIAVDWERTVNDIFDRTMRFPKSHRFLLGQRIDEIALEVALLVTDAHFTRDDRRRTTLAELNLRLNRLRLLLRLSHQRQCLDTRGYEHVMRGVDAFGRGLGAWMKQLSVPAS